MSSMARRSDKAQSPDAGWCTIESDPGVFTELIKSIGVKGVQVEEIYSLDAKALVNVSPVYGLIFLFKWHSGLGKVPHTISHNANIFFAQQVINNACATQAILSILLNTPEVDVGPELSSFKKETADFPPSIKGLAIGNIDSIRTAHNSFQRPEPFVSDGMKQATDDDDVYHFVSFIPFEGRMYELDGLKDGPVDLGEIKGGNWVEQIVPHVQKFIDTYSKNEIRFNLMAVVRDRIETLNDELKSLTDKNASDEAILRVQDQIKMEQQKREQWQIENVRRKHNYIPFLVYMLKALAERGKLADILNAQEKK